MIDSTQFEKEDFTWTADMLNLRAKWAFELLKIHRAGEYSMNVHGTYHPSRSSEKAAQLAIEDAEALIKMTIWEEQNWVRYPASTNSEKVSR